jgi:hypothetical protein
MTGRASPGPAARERAARATGITILTPDGVFVSRGLSSDEESTRIGPLSDHVRRRVAARPQPAGALLGGALGEARRYAQQIEGLPFCLNELMPFLRSLGKKETPHGEDLPRISAAEYQALKKRARALLAQLDRPLPAPEVPDSVAAQYWVPCAVVSGEVIPLERVASDPPYGFFVTVRGERYWLRTEDRRPLRDFFMDSRREELRRAERFVSERPELTQAAEEFLGDAKSILQRCRPRNRGRYQIFHNDRHHQLQHSRGSWMLVRGPVRMRTRKGSLFVGLPIAGATRAKRLSMTPRPSATRNDLWTPRGEPAHGGFCMGSFEQYRHLLSGDYFSDAEAIVQWLDAGVILATGRSSFHRRWRDLAEGRLPRRRLRRGG